MMNSTNYLPRVNGTDLTVWFTSPSGYEYELPVRVTAGYEPPCGNGWDEPRDAGGYFDPVAYYHREGRGWKQVELTSSQEEMLCERLKEEDGRWYY